MTLILEREARIFTYENEIYNQVRSNIDDRQREIFLREQMRVLSEQLGKMKRMPRWRTMNPVSKLFVICG